MAEKKAFPLEKILTIDPSEYRNITNIEMKDYLLVGVHATGMISNSGRDSVIDRFAQEVPSNAMMVVSYIPRITHVSTSADLTHYFKYIATGIALVPKPKTD